ncbi:hypothetical protein ACETRX_02780 [Labrys portucalensis]|uniref:Helix-turn-helix domain-containing protein n=1 Tax=Labrys neptuniae TaxID=376174 RepID=A0ABV6Z8K1_9HYPH
MPVIFDLLGDPIPENWGKRGRPMHAPTDEKRKLIIQLLSFGWSHERIAGAIGITVPTLKKNYFQLLKLRDFARDKVEATRAAILWSEVEKGNVTAIKEYGKLIEKQDARLASRHFQSQSAPAAGKKVKLGKKQIAQLAAEKVGEGTGWGDDLLPPGFERSN